MQSLLQSLSNYIHYNTTMRHMELRLSHTTSMFYHTRSTFHLKHHNFMLMPQLTNQSIFPFMPNTTYNSLILSN